MTSQQAKLLVRRQAAILLRIYAREILDDADFLARAEGRPEARAIRTARNRDRIDVAVEEEIRRLRAKSDEHVEPDALVKYGQRMRQAP